MQHSAFWSRADALCACAARAEVHNNDDIHAVAHPGLPLIWYRARQKKAKKLTKARDFTCTMILYEREQICVLLCWNSTRSHWYKKLQTKNMIFFYKNLTSNFNLVGNEHPIFLTIVKMTIEDSF